MSGWSYEDPVARAIALGAERVERIAKLKIVDEALHVLTEPVHRFMREHPEYARFDVVQNRFGPMDEAAEAQFWLAAFIAESDQQEIVTARIVQQSLERRCKYPPWCWPWR
jgi:hypothetical protein